MTTPVAGAAPPPGLTAAQVAALVALIDAQSRLRAQLTAAAVEAALAAFGQVADWWSAAAVDRAVSAALRVIQPMQRQAARITDAYLARAASTMSGRTVRPAGLASLDRLRTEMSDKVLRELVADRRRAGYLLLGEHQPGQRRTVPAAGIDAPEPAELADALDPLDPRAAYGRVADQYRYQVVAEGVPEQRARQKALVRVGSVAETDVTLAVREQVRKTLGGLRGITGYRRILRPELSETGPCGLCVVAADRKYKVEHLLPIHDRCCCDVLPILGDVDPGVFLNASDLNRLYSAAGGTSGYRKDGEQIGLKAVRVALAEHGELGPVLVDDGQHYRGPADVARATHPDRRVRDQAKLDAFEERLGILLARQARGEGGLGRAIEWQTERVEQLRGALGRAGDSGSVVAPTRERVTA